MSAITSRRITNYFLTICFILLIIVFIISLIAMSKLVLTQIEPIQKHVADTRNLLEDIHEVEKATTNKTNLEDISKFGKKNYFEFNYKGFNVTSLSFNNVNKNKSIVTFFINKPIGESEGIYYIAIDNLDELANGDTIVYLSDLGTQTGRFISFQEGKLLVEESENTQITQIPKEWFLGKVFYINTNQND